MGRREVRRSVDSDRAKKVRSVYSRLDCDLLLDVGCGCGGLSVLIGQACDAEQIYGIDTSARRIEQAAARGVHTVRQDVNGGLAFKSERFHSIHAGEVLDYLDDPAFFVSEVHRCLIESGTFVVSTANLASLHNRIALGLGKAPYPMRAAADSETYAEGDSRPVLSNRSKLFTLQQLQRLLRREGFEILDVIGARSEPAFRSHVLETLEDLLVRYPPLSYRNIIVCRKASGVAPRRSESEKKTNEQRGN